MLAELKVLTTFYNIDNLKFVTINTKCIITLFHTTILITTLKNSHSTLPQKHSSLAHFEYYPR